MIEVSKLSDNDLVRSLQSNENSEKCLNELIERHSGICINLINKFISSSYNESLRRELIKEKDYQIYKSALKFNFDKSIKFSTYLGNEVRWNCLNIYNKNKKRKTIAVEENLIDYFSFFSNKNQEDSKKDVFESIISYSNKHPDKRVGKIFHLRYVIGKNNSVMPWSLISKNLGMSIQGCINIHDSAMLNFKTKIRKELNE